MRICIVIEFFYPDNTGGTGPVISDLARHLKDAYDDVEIDVITSSNLYRISAPGLPKEEDWDGVRIYRIPTAETSQLSIASRLAANLQFTYRSLQKLFSLGKYDVILVGTNPPMIASAAAVYKTFTHTPYVYLTHDLEPDRSVVLGIFGQGHPFVQIMRVFQRNWLHSAERVIALGDCMRDYILGAYQLPESKVSVIHVGANENVLTPGNRMSRFRKTHNIEGFVVLYTGNFGRYHNFDTILDAAKILRKENHNVNFVLVGAGVKKEHIAGRIENEAIDNVRMFGFVPTEEYSDLLASADVSMVTLEKGMEKLCLPSKFYTILASGRPVLAILSPKSDVALVSEKFKCGLQVDQGDTAALVEALTWFVQHPMEGAEMGENARAAFVAHFGTNIIAEQYYDIFQSIGQQNNAGGDSRVPFAAVEEKICS